MHHLVQTLAASRESSRQIGVIETGIQRRRQRLRARNQRPTSPSPIPIVFLVVGLLVLDKRLYYLLYIPDLY